VLDHNHLITADFPNYVFEGKKIRLRAGFPGMLRSEFVTMFTGVIDSVASMDGNTRLHLCLLGWQGVG
jgi:hypothetical protein